MRLIAGTRRGVQVLRWIKGERSASIEARALEAEEISAAVVHGGTVLVGTRRGKVFRSADRGSSWEPASEGLACDAVCDLAAGRAGSRRIYAGGEPASVFASDDDGRSWRELESFRAMGDAEEWKPYGERAAHVEALTVDPQADRRLYAGVEVGGAYITEDEGHSWRTIDDGLFEEVHSLLVDPREGAKLYALTGAGLYVSDNRGLSWSAAAEEVGSAYGTVMLVRTDQSGDVVLYVAIAGGTPGTWEGQGADARLLIGRARTDVWEAASIGGRRTNKDAYTAIAADPLDPESLFVGTSGGAIHYGSEAGRRWSTIHRGADPILTLSTL